MVSPIGRFPFCFFTFASRKEFIDSWWYATGEMVRVSDPSQFLLLVYWPDRCFRACSTGFSCSFCCLFYELKWCYWGLPDFNRQLTPNFYLVLLSFVSIFFKVSMGWRCEYQPDNIVTYFVSFPFYWIKFSLGVMFLFIASFTRGNSFTGAVDELNCFIQHLLQLILKNCFYC